MRDVIREILTMWVAVTGTIVLVAVAGAPFWFVIWLVSWWYR